MASPSTTAQHATPPWLRGYVFVGAGLLVAGLFLYTHNVALRLERQARTSTRVLADFFATVTLQAIESEPVHRVFRDVLDRVDFPVVVTDAEGRPIAWRRVDVDPNAVSVQEQMAFDPTSPPVDGPLAELHGVIQAMDSENPPVPMIHPQLQRKMGEVHFGESRLVRELRWVPVVELFAFFLFIALGYLGFRSARVAEQRYIWVGMAKETAHQLGTPTSSLLGWLEMLRLRGDSGAAAGTVSLERRFFEETVAEMSSDIDRLGKVAARFSQVGSTPQKKLQPLTPVVEATVRYVRRRAGAGTEIRERYAQSPPVAINAQLIEWVIENVLKNALDASSGGGQILVEVFPHLDGEAIEVDISDQGAGMDAAQQRRAFAPGFSTKQRGWGLGLSLAKRIIEEYHGGRIWIKRSRLGEGTTIAMSLPC